MTPDLPFVLTGSPPAHPDISAFNLLYDKYAKKVYGFLLLHCVSPRLAEELFIEIFLKLQRDIKLTDADEEKKVVATVLLMYRLQANLRHSIPAVSGRIL